MKENQYLYRVLVAFSGTVRDPAKRLEYTESQMNGIAETQTAETLKQAEYRWTARSSFWQIAPANNP